MGTATAPELARLDAVMMKSLADIIADEQLIRRLRFDLRVTADERQPSGYDRIIFTLTSVPGIAEILTRPTMKSVQVLIFDEFGNTLPRTYQLSSRGETQTHTEIVPLADPSKLHGTTDRGRTIYVLVDPFNVIGELFETNNLASAYCYTIG